MTISNGAIFSAILACGLVGLIFFMGLVAAIRRPGLMDDIVDLFEVAIASLRVWLPKILPAAQSDLQLTSPGKAQKRPPALRTAKGAVFSAKAKKPNLRLGNDATADRPARDRSGPAAS